jgi:hypothetical protein
MGNDLRKMKKYPNRSCKYRNCDKDISYMRKDAKFCCRNHKSYERLYKLRELKRGSTKI